MAAERAERHAKRRLRFDSERRSRRERTSTVDLLAEAMTRAARLSTVQASQLEQARAGVDTPNGPPRQQTLTDDPRWEDSVRVIRRRVLMLLDLLDEAEGTGHAAVVAAMDGADKDRLIVQEGRGLIAEMVVAELGPEIGSAAYVRRLRRSLGLDSRGYPADVAAPKRAA